MSAKPGCVIDDDGLVVMLQLAATLGGSHTAAELVVAF